MAGILNNLYPPVIDSVMPSFVISSERVKVYFSLSSYNSKDDLLESAVQVMVNNQNNSLTALDPTEWKTGIALKTLQIDEDVSGDYKYYIEISSNDLKDGFQLNQYYKVQIRFTGTDASVYNKDSNEKIASWLDQNEAYFSEWSTVCLIKGISSPQIILKGFEDASEASTATETILTFTEVVDVIGELTFSADDESEYLSFYDIVITDESEKTIYDSGNIYTNEYYPNEINHTIQANLVDSTTYTLTLTYTTNNGYTDLVSYEFTTISYGIDDLNATVTAEADQDNGRIAISVVSTDGEEFLSNLCIRRTSSESNFTLWEDFYVGLVAKGEPLNETIYDYTVESGVWYRYCAQKINSKGQRGTTVLSRYPVMIYLDDIFLTRDNMQIRIKYDPQISSFKKTLSESKTDTIGSTYPYFRRNGNLGYRQFSISGLITAFMDEDGIFINKESTFGDNLEYYEDFNEENFITDYNDFVYERKFREQIMDFLYADSAVLYRSLPEGNILIRLMDVSFTPNESLGRLIYSFSATAYEIDECSLTNYDKYGIWSIGEYSTLIGYTYDQIGQLSDSFSITKTDGITVTDSDSILKYIQSELDLITHEGYIRELMYLKWVRLEFQSDPYLIKVGTDGSLTPYTDSSEYSKYKENIVYGYIVYINGNATLVSKKGYFELLDDDTAVYSIYFPVETTVIVDYLAYIEESEDTSKIASRLYYYIKPGQLFGCFDLEDSLSRQIYVKCWEDRKDYYQKLTAIDKIAVETSTGAVLYVKDSFDSQYYRHVVGPTGVLSLYDDEATISAFYFCGMHLNPMTDETRLEPEDTEYYDTGIFVTSLDSIENPIKNGVYTIYSEVDEDEDGEADVALTTLASEENTVTVDVENTIYNSDEEEYNLILSSVIGDSNQYIWYHNQWYQFATSTGDVICPVEGLVNYIYEMIKGEY